MEDLGLVFGRDPVAVDAASLDLVCQANDGEDPFKKHHGVDGSFILEYAEKIGLGRRGYELVDV